MGLNYDYAKDIVKAYNQRGEVALANRRRQRTAPPSHALLNSEQLEELRYAVIEVWSFDEQTLVPRYRFAIV